MRGDLYFLIMTVLVTITSVAWWLFCAAYQMRSKWWKNPYGRNLMSVGLITASLHSMIAFYAITDYWNVGLTFIAYALLSLSVYTAVRRTVLMDRAQRRGDDRH